ncbi:Calmodulin [Fasciola gigantica]|uniref:Calmodulin n=1 Tax=Fasciola gigantica TaxID=46835 RepID=A0A504YXB8_FASGI|nr:Calmodulin [Fasciola gigantica]
MSRSSLDGSLASKEETNDEVDEEIMKTHHLTKQRVSELREIFRFLDRDSGGTVSGQELSSLIRLVSSNYTEHEIKLLMNKADMNGDGEMGFEEFVQLLSCEPTDPQQETSATREAFEVFDADNDGFITKLELLQVMTRIGHNFSEQEVEEMLSEADQDGDGRVTYAEFEAMLKEGPNDVGS